MTSAEREEWEDGLLWKWAFKVKGRQGVDDLEKMDIFHARHMCIISKTSLHIFDLIACLSQEARGCILTGLGAISDLYQN